MTDENNGTDNKVIFLGEAGVGKTSLMKISTGGTFDEEYNSSISLSFSPRTVEYNNSKYIFNLWDTIGQEKYRSLTKIFFKKSKIVIFVYDITDKASFDNLEYWINAVSNELSSENYIKAIVGNKSDLFLNEKIKEDEAEKYATSKHCKFKLCSAKNDPLNFVKFLDQLCIELIKKNEANEERKKETVTLNKKEIKKDKKNCSC